MQELIQRFLPYTSRGGHRRRGVGRAGIRAGWPKQATKSVLADPVAKHVSQAREASGSQPLHPLAGVTQGDARSLMHDDCVADVVLLMGPLYHLTKRNHRKLRRCVRHTGY